MRLDTKWRMAEGILLTCLQSWGDTPQQKVEMWQTAIHFMGLKAVISIVDMDGGKHYTAEGDDAVKALCFIDEVCNKFPMGKFELERTMIEECMDKHGRRRDGLGRVFGRK